MLTTGLGVQEDGGVRTDSESCFMEVANAS